uniref:Transmembrane protein 138 n=1 Tax=Onchocerca volvulus TaxID=6282 RepID=A0A8R1TKH7_ONCVO
MANKYGTLLMIQIGMISLDFIFNILNVLITANDAVQLMLHLLQDTLIVLSIIVIIIAFSSTFVFQAGLITVLLSKFATTIIFSSIYLALSILFHFYDMRHRWSVVVDHSKWSRISFMLFILQRIGNLDIILQIVELIFMQQYFIISHIKGPYYCYQIQNIIMIRNGSVNKYVEKINIK